MTSSKLSNRRQTARKPPVCISGAAVGSIQRQRQETGQEPVPSHRKRPGEPTKYTPRKGQCPPIPEPPPPSDITCHIGADEPTVEFEGTADIEMRANNPDYPEDQVVACNCYASAGSFECPVILNGMTQWGEFEAPGEPGTHHLTAEFTWPNTTDCVAECDVEEEEEPE